jgi:hypothetical protein
MGKPHQEVRVVRKLYRKRKQKNHAGEGQPTGKRSPEKCELQPTKGKKAKTEQSRTIENTDTSWVDEARGTRTRQGRWKRKNEKAQCCCAAEA